MKYRALCALLMLMCLLLLTITPAFAQDAPANTPVDTSPLQNFIGILSTTLLEAAAPFITALVFGVLWRIYQFINARLSSTQHEFLDYLVTTAVQAAEQAGLTNQITNTGREKKAFAVQSVMDILSARGYGNVAKYIPQVEMLVESAINRGVQDYNKAIIDSRASSVPPAGV